MRFTVNRSEFSAAIVAVAGAVCKYAPKPALRCVKIVASADRLTLSTTDLERCIVHTFRLVQVEEAGECLVNCDELAKLAKRLTDGALRFACQFDAKKLEGVACGTMTITGQSSRHSLPIMDCTQFPPMPADADGETLTIDGKTLAGMIDAALPSVARDSTRWAFSGIYFVAGRKMLEVIATDGRRQSRITATADTVSPGSAIVPLATAKLARKLFAKSGAVKMFLESTKTKSGGFAGRAVFAAGDTVVSSSAVEGEFPPYLEVIPKDCPCITRVGAADLLAAVESVGGELLALELSSQFGIKLRADGNSADVLGSANFPCKYAGVDMRIGINSRFMVEALKTAAKVADEITVEFTAPNRPVLITAGKLQIVIISCHLAGEPAKSKPAPKASTPAPAAEPTPADPIAPVRTCAPATPIMEAPAPKMAAVWPPSSATQRRRAVANLAKKAKASEPAPERNALPAPAPVESPAEFVPAAEYLTDQARIFGIGAVGPWTDMGDRTWTALAQAISDRIAPEGTSGTVYVMVDASGYADVDFTPAPVQPAAQPAPVADPAVINAPAQPAPAAAVADRPLTRREKSEQRRNAFREISKQFASMPAAQRMALVEQVGAIPTVEGRTLSGANSALLMLQRGGVSMVGGFRQWLAAGRCVRKGEHGLMIWVKCHAPKNAATDESSAAKKAAPRFITGTVFDIAQTDPVRDHESADDLELAEALAG